MSVNYVWQWVSCVHTLTVCRHYWWRKRNVTVEHPVRGKNNKQIEVRLYTTTGGGVELKYFLMRASCPGYTSVYSLQLSNRKYWYHVQFFEVLWEIASSVGILVNLQIASSVGILVNLQIASSVGILVNLQIASSVGILVNLQIA